MLYFVEVQVKDGKATYNVLQEKNKRDSKTINVKNGQILRKVNCGFSRRGKKDTQIHKHATNRFKNGYFWRKLKG